MRINVSFEADLPVDATEAEVREWVEFEIGAGSVLSNSNPLQNQSLEPLWVSVDIA